MTCRNFLWKKHIIGILWTFEPLEPSLSFGFFVSLKSLCSSGCTSNVPGAVMLDFAVLDVTDSSNASPDSSAPCVQHLFKHRLSLHNKLRLPLSLWLLHSAYVSSVLCLKHTPELPAFQFVSFGLYPAELQRLTWESPALSAEVGPCVFMQGPFCNRSPHEPSTEIWPVLIIYNRQFV